MNKTVIKNFAIWARNKLIADVQYRAGLLGITENGIANRLPQSTKTTDFYDIGTTEPFAVSGKVRSQREKLVEVLREKEKETDYDTAYKYVLEEVAYTWFNRLIAVRFMEVNDYFPSHVRVLSSENGKMEPDIVTEPFNSELLFSDSEKELVLQLQKDNKIDDLFRLLFIKQCNSMNELLPYLFEKTDDYTELLLYLSVVDKEGVVYKLVNDIPEEDFDVNRGGQVEIIGWLYQYYNTEPKNAAFAKNGKITKEEIPAVTQLFTPDWIVRYMVENSLGRLWLEGHPNETLQREWKYYLEEAEQESEVEVKLAEIREEHAKLNPEDIKLIDPRMVSGHILVYAFDVFMQIYESAGWSQRDAARSILENNIYGLDIDDRAGQMAYFAVMMKARQYNRRILSKDTKFNVYAIQESNGITTEQLKRLGAGLSNIEMTNALNQVNGLIENFKDAKEYGSIINVEEYDWDLLKRFATPKEMGEGQMSLDIYGTQEVAEKIQHLLPIAKAMAQKYEVVVTNPPYMGISNGSSKLNDYVKKHFSEGKEDLFSVFIMKCMQYAQQNAFASMITQHTWMFLSRAEKLRDIMLNNNLINMIHLGTKAFDEISGEVVQTVTFIYRKKHMNDYNSVCCRAINGISENEKEKLFLSRNSMYEFCQDDFYKIPGKIMSYWISQNFINNFENEKFADIVDARVGLDTGDNDTFLRLWPEVDFVDINMKASAEQEFFESKRKYAPHTKGGSYRKWYGNFDYVIKFDELSYNRLSTMGNHLPSRQFYFKEGASWTRVSSKFAVRYSPKGMVFNSACPTIFCKQNLQLYTLALINSIVTSYYVELLSPTINFQAGDIGKIPYLKSEKCMTEINEIAKECLKLSECDWNSYENSWDFVTCPLIKGKTIGRLVENKYKEWETECEERFNQLKANEEELNRIFIDIYGLQDEIVPEVDDKDVTVRKADLQRDIKSLLSYAVGCMFGRYSLDVEGLAYAGGEWDASKYTSFIPDDDNVIPITDEEYLEDDIVARLCEWLKVVYGEDTLSENLDFIANSIGTKGSTSKEKIRNYFLNNFFADHCATYSVTGSGKRPIYWLFDSGKQNGFKALVYLHRYTPDTIGNLRVDYLHRMQKVYENQISHQQNVIDNSTDNKEINKATKRKETLQKQLKECRDYDEKIGHLALSRIELDLDDGVKYNYRKVQTASDGVFYEVLADSKKIMMDEKKYREFKA